MKGQAEFKQQMIDALSGIIKTCAFLVTDLGGEANILLVGKDFALYVCFERECADIDHCDLRRPPNRQSYGLGHFLVQSRHVPCCGESTDEGPDRFFIRWHKEMDWFINALLTHGRDILAGDREWIKQYPYKGHEVPSNVVSKARETLKSHGREADAANI